MATQTTTSSALPATQVTRASRGQAPAVFGAELRTRATAPRGTDARGRQLIQVDRGQVGQQFVKFTESPGLERLLNAAR